MKNRWTSDEREWNFRLFTRNLHWNLEKISTSLRSTLPTRRNQKIAPSMVIVVLLRNFLLVTSCTCSVYYRMGPECSWWRLSPIRMVELSWSGSSVNPPASARGREHRERKKLKLLSQCLWALAFVRPKVQVLLERGVGGKISPFNQTSHMIAVTVYCLWALCEPLDDKWQWFMVAQLPLIFGIFDRGEEKRKVNKIWR